MCKKPLTVLLALAFFTAVACEEGTSPTDAGPDTMTVDTGVEDTGPEDTAQQDSGEDTTQTDVVSGPRVTLLAPQDGATVQNPVVFRVEASGVATVQIEADDYALAEPWDPAQQDSLTYEFNGTGFEREVILYGYNEAGAAIASDTIRITVEGQSGDGAKGDPIGTFWTTYYYLAYEENYSGPDDTTLYGEGCTEVAQVPAGFGDAICIEGSGKLEDGTVLNYATRCTCGGPCNICWAEMDPDSFPWGQGSRGNALEPFRSWAVDTDIISHGTVLYVEEWDGVEIPEVDGIGGFTHDGCFRADDVGGGIDGMHFDFFAGTPDMWRALEQIYPTRSEFVVYENSGRCSL